MSYQKSDSANTLSEQILATFENFCIRQIVNQHDWDEYRTMILQHGPSLFSLTSVSNQASAIDLPRLCLALGRGIWLNTPHPAFGYAKPSLAKPERNQPCYCLSLKKYKHCCEQFASLADMQSRRNWLPLLLGMYSQKKLQEIASYSFDCDELADTCHQWNAAGMSKQAVILLEPRLAHAQTLDEAAELLFDALCDAYTLLHKPRKKIELIQRFKTTKNPALSSNAYLRSAMLLKDQGKASAAWQEFLIAQRLAPDNPSLAIYEIVHLLDDGQTQQAKQRADFWQARLKKDKRADYSRLIQRLQQLVAEKPNSGLFGVLLEENPALERLRQQLLEQPDAANNYAAITRQDPIIQVLPKLKKIEKKWHQLQDDLIHSPIQEWANQSCEFIEKEPNAINSFEVLHTLADEILQEYGINHGSYTILGPLYQRSSELLTQIVGQAPEQALQELTQPSTEQMENGVPFGLLPWGFLDNRSALGLLNQAISCSLQQHSANALDLMRWAVYVLNPNDNAGWREPLLAKLIAQQQLDEATQLAKRYANDSSGFQLLSALLYWIQDQPATANQLIQTVCARSPKVLTMLLHANPKKPKMNSNGFIQLGGADEAWHIRSLARPLFEQYQALDWLRQQSKV